MKNMKLDQLAKQYIIDTIQLDDDSITSDKDKLQGLFDAFKAEYGWAIPKMGMVNAYREWLQGAPGTAGIEFYNHKIIEIAISWGSLPASPTDSACHKILENWFNLIAVKTFQLFKKNKIKGVTL